MGSVIRPAGKALLLLLFLPIVLSPRTPAQEPRSTAPPSTYDDFVITAFASLADTHGMARKLSVDLGTLPAGKAGIATVTIKNPFDQPIPISRAQASRSYARSRLLTNVLPAEGDAPLDILIHVPDRGATASLDGNVDLFVDMENCKIPALRVISVRVKYSVSGMLSFPERSVMLGILPGQSREVSLPFVHTLKDPAENLKIRVTGFLHGVNGKLVPGDPISHIQLTLRAEDATPEGAYGSITISSGESGPSDKLNVVLYLEAATQISPRMLQFRPSDQGLVATAVLHFSEAEDERSEDAIKATLHADHPEDRGPKSVFCEALLHGKRLKVEQQRLSRLVYRLKVRFDGDAEELDSIVSEAGGKRVIDWNVVTDRDRQTLKSLFSSPEPSGADQ